MKPKSLALAGIALSLVALPGTALAKKDDAVSNEVTLHIEANGIVPPDRVVLTVPFEAVGTTREAALAELRQNQESFVKQLTGSGIAADRIITEPPKDQNNGRASIAVYDAAMAAEDAAAPAAASAARGRSVAKPKPQVGVESDITVSLDDLSKLDVVQAAAAGPGVQAYRLYNSARFTTSDPAAAASKARDQAIAKARAEAEGYAASLGYRVVRMTRVSNSAPPFSLLDVWRMMNIVDFNATRFQPSYYAGITPATVAIDFVIAPK